MSKQNEAGTPQGSSAAEAVAPQKLDPWFLELLACPGCDNHPALALNAATNTLDCAAGIHAFPIRDGIPILLLEEATLLKPQAESSTPANR